MLNVRFGSLRTLIETLGPYGCLGLFLPWARQLRVAGS
jgi:hypothetical protein